MSSDEDDNRRKKRRRNRSFWPYPITNLHPGYGESDGRLDRIEPVGSVRMQQILPRYELSTARTRTTGLGPALTDGPVFSPPGNERSHDAADDASGPEAGETDRGPESEADNEALFEDEDRGLLFDVEA